MAAGNPQRRFRQRSPRCAGALPRDPQPLEPTRTRRRRAPHIWSRSACLPRSGHGPGQSLAGFPQPPSSPDRNRSGFLRTLVLYACGPRAAQRYVLEVCHSWRPVVQEPVLRNAPGWVRARLRHTTGTVTIARAVGQGYTQPDPFYRDQKGQKPCRTRRRSIPLSSQRRLTS